MTKPHTTRWPDGTPRSTAEAFPIGPEYGCAIERPRPYPRTLWVTMAVAVVYLAGLLLWEVM